MCLHIGTGFGAISMAPDAPIDNMMILATQVSAMCAQDLLWGPAMRNYPDFEVRVLRGRHRLDPVLSGSQRPALHQPEVAAPRLRRQAAQRCLPRAFAGLLRHRQDVVETADEIGIDIIAWECDYPHSDCFWPDAPEQVLAELNAAGADDSDINKITWENSCRFFGWDPFARKAREETTVAALRATATDVDTTIRPRKEWAARYAEKQLTKHKSSSLSPRDRRWRVKVHVDLTPPSISVRFDVGMLHVPV